MSLFARHCCARLSVVFGTGTSFGILSAWKSLWNKFIFRWPNQKPTPVLTDWGAKLTSLCSFKTSPFLSSKAPSRKSVKKKQGIWSIPSSIQVINSHRKICAPWFVAEGFSGRCSCSVFPNPEPQRDKESCIPLSGLAAKQRPEEEPEGCIFSPDAFCLAETGNFRHFTCLQCQTCEILNLLHRTLYL